MLSAINLSKSFDDELTVTGVSVDIGRGQIVGLMGPNGAGKSTIFAMIAGFEQPDRGRVFLDSIEITHAPMYERARRGISYLTQEPSVFRDITVEQNIILAVETLALTTAEQRQLVESLLQRSGLTRLRKVLAGKLSGGERRRAEIARALAGDPSFVLLDEPFAGIDPIAVNGLQSLVRDIASRGIGVLITDHNVRETLKLVDRGYIIDAGQILMHGTPATIVADPRVRETYLGTEFRR